MVEVNKDLFELLRAHSALVPPKFLTFPSNLRVEDVHDFLLAHIILNKHLATYPPSHQYQHSFWKWAIYHLEDMAAETIEDVDIDTRIYDHYLTLPSPSHAPGFQAAAPSSSYISHFWPAYPTIDGGTLDSIDLTSYRTITLLESRTTIESGTTGLRTWPASFTLSQYLISHPEIVSRKIILELGCGAGFLAVIVASLQQLMASLVDCPIWLSDINEEVLIRCRYNVQLPCNSSSTHPSIRYCLLDWSHSLDPVKMPHIQHMLQEIDAELVLGADLVFDPSLIPALVGVLRIALQPSPRSPRKISLLALTLRNQDTYSNFLQTADQHLVVEDLNVPTNDDIFLGAEGSSRVIAEVKILKITLKR